jgi:hypothetical protein
MTNPLEDGLMDQDYQPHIRHTHADLESQSWCGKMLNRNEWTFQNVDHALYAIEQGMLQEPCPQCLRAVSKAMEKTDENLRAFKKEYAAGLKSGISSASDWHPIETAPRDRIILLYRPTQKQDWLSIAPGRYEDQSHCTFSYPFWASVNEENEFDDREHPPTHWMLLPEAPATIQ